MKIDTSMSSSFKIPTKATDKGKEEKLLSACRDFEAFFLQKMLSLMRESIPKSDLLGPSYARDTFQNMLDGEMARKLSRSGGMGLADSLFQQLARK